MKQGLGFEVAEHLRKLGIETPILGLRTKTDGKGPQYRANRVCNAVSEILTALKMDLKDDSLKDTPKRVSKMFLEEIFYGLDYGNFPKITTVENKMKYDEMIVCKSTVHSCCEHHLVPFIGTAYVGYLAETKIIGLSKINRIVDFFSRRPQIQERLTEQVSATLKFVLQTNNVAVVIKAEHMCVKLRGVKDANSHTTTSKMSGKFRTVPELRAEFFATTR